jgi:hypothetical protein
MEDIVVNKIIPDEFLKIIKDFVRDITITFPEYKIFIDKWWKYEDDVEKNKNSLKFIFNYCLKKYPPRFFDILYQNNDIFKEDALIDTEFLPYIHFKNIWHYDISDKTKDTIWKYLQLILFSVVSTLKTQEHFGETAKLFNNVDKNEFQEKLKSSLEEIQKLFIYNDETKTDEENEKTGINVMKLPQADKINDHISGLIDGKLGSIAKQIAEETASELNLAEEFENVTDIKGVFDSLFKNPAKLMNLVKNVSEKLDTRMKSGDINEQEMMSEAGELVNKLKDIPGLGNIQSLISGLNLNNFLDPNKKENAVPKTNKYKFKKNKKPPTPSNNSSSQSQFSDQDIIELFNSIAPKK